MMKDRTQLNRRSFLKTAGMGSLLLIGGGLVLGHLLPEESSVRTSSDPAFDPDVEIDLRAVPGEVALFPGASTRVRTFEASLRKGPAGTLTPMEESYLGPPIRLQKGQRVRIRFSHNLDETSIVHWHGLHVPELADGHPRFVIPRGETYVYEFEVRNRPGTYWYHPHPHGRTGPQVYSGMAGLLIITDPEEESPGLPSGTHDIPVVLQDRTFDRDNQLVYLNRGMMDRMTGFLGDQMLINGRFPEEQSVATRPYRLRVLNGSNSRIYKLAWSDGTPVTVLGTDGGLLDQPVHRPYVVLAPAERIDVWRDFGSLPVGSQVTLQSLPFSVNGMQGMGGGMMGRRRGTGSMMEGQSLPNGSEFPVLHFRVDRRENSELTLPDRLAPLENMDPETAVNRRNPRTFQFALSRMQWTINGRVFEMEEVARDEVVQLNTTEIWEFINGGNRGMMGGMMGTMMQMPHPVHIHGLQFRILERQILDPELADWAHLGDGFVDEGWQDSFLLLPGTAVKVLLRFEDYPGLFLYHCHNLEHEDMGMMRNYRIVGT